MDDNIIAEVLLRLPLKSLTRCKCLSNKWNSLISYDTNFRRNYLLKLGSSSSSSSPLLLGFFFTRKPSPPLPPELFQPVEEQHQVKFLPTSTQGEKLKAGDYQTWGAPSLPHPFDESLRYIGHESFCIVAVSNGFLLCCLEQYDFPMNYYVCNPITKEWVALPKPQLTCDIVPTGFICQGNYPCFDLVNYKVVRGLWPDVRTFSNKLTFEIFSSESFQWKVFNLTCPLFFHLELSSPFVVIEKQGAVHWSAITQTFQRAFVTFNPTHQCLQLASLPGELNYDSECFSQSSGLLLYARHDRHDLELWVLREGDGSGKEWSLKYKVDLQMLMGANPGLFEGSHMYFDIIGFHPSNPFVLYMWKERTMATYNFEGSTIELISHPIPQGWLVYYLFSPYVWPNWPPFFP